MRQMKIIGLLCSTLLLVCCSEDDSEEISWRAERMVEISSEVDDLIEDKSCNGSDDCASIAWGSKPCGGPWSYLIYAPANVDVPQLEQLVDEYNKLQKEVNQLTGAGSDCAVVEEPELDCADNVCKALY